MTGKPAGGPAAGRIGPGAFIAVVGASGAGKDSLLAYAREHLAPGDTAPWNTGPWNTGPANTPAPARFPRRVITRPPGPGEDHEPVTAAEFAAARARGDFALSWDAHGLAYGIPVSADADVRDGRIVVVNVSRTVLPGLAARYERLAVVLVTVSEDVRARRLRARGREPDFGISQRLARPDPAPGYPVDAVISNDGSLAEGGGQLMAVIRGAAAGSVPRPGIPRPGR